LARFDETGLTIKNSITNEIIPIQLDAASKSQYRFRRACIGLDRIKNLFGLTLYFVTLTVRDENVDAMNRDLNKFLNWLRSRFKRKHFDIYYVWVVELQKKRYRKYGIKALHWHFAIVCADGALPHSEKRGGRMHLVEDGNVITVKDIIKYWGKGDIVFSLRAWSRGVYGYLSKYFAKDYSQLGDYKPEWANLRRFGSSQLRHYAFPKWAYEWVDQELSANPELRDLYIRKVGSKVGFYAKDEKKKFVTVKEIRSPWKLVVETPEDSGDSSGTEKGVTLATDL
jgi:hypothetical protein